MPSVDKPAVTDNRDGTVSLRYEPKVEGMHEVVVKCNQDQVPGSPFHFHVDSLSCGYVTATGPGLVKGAAGEPCNFTLYSKNVKANSVAVKVDGPSRCEVHCQDQKDGTVGVTYLPPAPGDYKISVRVNDKHIRGSPFLAKILGVGRKRSQISLAHTSNVKLNTREKDTKNLNASIVAPSGLEEPCFVKKNPDGSLGVSFTPRENGEHHINVRRLGQPIQGSPFKINILESEIGDASSVQVTGTALQEAKTHADNEFILNTKSAGFGALSISIEGPSKCDLTCQDNEDGTVNVKYRPTEPGYYILNVKFADHHVRGSPFTIKATGQGSNYQREMVTKQVAAAPVKDVGQACELPLKLPGTNAFDMSARVVSPGGKADDAEIQDRDDCLYTVKFTGTEVGVHHVSVRCKDIHIHGSPFPYTIGPFRDHGAHRVHATGNGLERGVANEQSDFTVLAREAGAGTLTVSVEGPSKAAIHIRDMGEGALIVSYKVSEPGDYRIGLKFNEQPIPDSPFTVFVMPNVGDAHKVELGHIPDTNLQVKKPVAFTINMNGAKGMCDGKVISPSGTEDDCFVAPIDEDQWVLRFIPQENGIHQVHIRLEGIHIPQSPFRILVGQDDADPAAVTAQGPGLCDAKTGTKTDFIVDTCSAGAGTLSVTIDGPSKVSMDCTEVEEGYKVRYTPLAPGEYLITIKYNGYHIVGSPFKVLATGSSIGEIGGNETSNVVVETVRKQARQKADHLPRFKSDASKITSKGTGLKKAIPHRANAFTVNCGDAGNNILYVGVYGPKGPCDEVTIKHAGRNLYNVTYNVKDRGDHALIVKYGDEHIPGSPFKVET